MSVIDFNGTRLFLREEGAGRPVLLVHGTASTSTQWRSLSRHLSARFRVIAPDLPGNGNSEPMPGEGLDPYIDALRSVAEKHDEPAHVVGHSLGGVVALAFAMRHPELVRSLTVIEPVTFHLLARSTRADTRHLRTIQSVAGIVAAAACSDDAAGGVAHFIDFWNGPGAWSRLAPEVRTSLTDRVGRILADFIAEFAQVWTAADLRCLRCPTLGLMGMASQPVARRTTQLVVEAVTGAQLHMVMGAGHMLPVTNPEIVNPIVAGHLISVDARAHRSPRAA